MTVSGRAILNQFLKFLLTNLELLFWVMSLILLAIMNPLSAHFTLCPLQLAGFTWCPGCGLGHSISFLIHGDLQSSLQAHFLGGPALLIILYRIAGLLRFRLVISSVIFKNENSCPKTF